MRGERVPNRSAQRLPMANSFLDDTPRRIAKSEPASNCNANGRPSRSVDFLTADIEHEELLSGVRNVADPNYPMLARTLRARSENISATTSSLEASVPWGVWRRE